MTTHSIPRLSPRPLADSALLGRLREATAHAHLTVERHALLAPLLSHELTRGDYGRVLLCFFGYFRALERRLPVAFRVAFPVASKDAEYRYHRRSPLLLRDLQALGEAPPLSEPALPVPRLETPEQVLGTLYVLEGATQGGRIIGPKICSQLGLTPEHGAQYFHLFHRAQWPRYRVLLERQAHRCRATAVEAGALEAFATLHQHMDAGLRSRPPGPRQLHAGESP